MTLQQFLCVIIGGILGSWKVRGQDIDIPLNLIVAAANCLSGEVQTENEQKTSQLQNDFQWMTTLASAVRYFLDSAGAERQDLHQLIKYGQRHCTNLLSYTDQSLPSLFGLCSLEVLLSAWGNTELPPSARAHILRRYVENTYKDRGFLRDAIIEAAQGEGTILQYTYLFPKNRTKGRDEKHFTSAGVSLGSENLHSHTASSSIPSKRKFTGDENASLPEENDFTPIVWEDRNQKQGGHDQKR